MNLFDEKLGDETLIDNVQCIFRKLKTTIFSQLMVTDGESCEFSILVVSCSFAGYELDEVFMNNDV